MSSQAANIAQRARVAFEEAQKKLPSGQQADAARAAALANIRHALEAAKAEIQQANAQDVETARSTLSPALVSRLDLFSKAGKWQSMLDGVTQVAQLPTPLDKCTYARRLAEADARTGAQPLDLFRQTCPIGVLLCIFEARPEVIVNIASLAIKSGNAAILKGGKESKLTAAAISRVVAQALSQTQLPADLIQTVETRQDVSDLLHQDKYIDLVIPRGSNELVSAIQKDARMPVMGHADGLCAIYVHEDAEPKGTIGSILDAKLDYPAACNAVETLLLHQSLLTKGDLWNTLAKALLEAGVTLHCDAASRSALSQQLPSNLASKVVEAKDQDYQTEFLDLDLAVKVVSGTEEAIDHINTNGSHHTDAIFCAGGSDNPAAELFTRSLSSADVFVNCSTRFADGFRYGFGTEVGISTGRTHARGPVGLDGLVTYKYIVKSAGGVQAAGSFGASSGSQSRQWSHRDIQQSAGGVNVAIVGVGLVGSSVISQLTTIPSLASQLHIVALQNSKKTLLSTPEAPVSLAPPADWKALLANSSTPALALPELAKTLQQISASTQRHTVVVDNTSNDSVASFYPEFLKAGLSVVTPNKKGLSGSLDLYEAILAASAPAAGPTAPLVYGESTVGAGLPIIGTLKDLIQTGDKVKKIEGVLSGTLSYIFNEWSSPAGGDKKFSEIVKIAKDNGYTEPHPADDLSGSDVSRKLTILSRLVPSLTAHLPQGFASVPTHSLTPAPLESCTSGDEYVARLPEFDADFDALNQAARKEGCVLRYVGVIDVEQGQIKASLEKYPADHPFATSLSGSDNIIAFHTERYAARPLLVQGAGAGADVTAMGVVADLVRVAERRG